jgi:membrane protein required for colicin V production
MNWLDWFLIVFLLVSVVNGFREGFVRMGIGLAALIFGFLAASWFSGMLAGSLMEWIHSKALASLLAFQIIFFGIMIAGVLIAMVITRMLKLIGLSPVDRMLGGVFGAVRGFVVVVVVAMVITAFAPKWLPSSIRQSSLSPYVFGASRALTAITPFEIRSSFDRAYGELKDLWKEALRHRPSAKGLEIRRE